MYESASVNMLTGRAYTVSWVALNGSGLNGMFEVGRAGPLTLG